MNKKITSTFSRLITMPVLGLVIGVLFTTMLVAAASTNASADSVAKQVLYINAFHRGYGWSDEIENGIQDTFDASGSNIELSMVYLDSLRYQGESISEKLAELLAIKRVANSTDLVITSDNAALDFALRHQKVLFPSQPIIYTALKDFPAGPLNTAINSTGISEYIDYKNAVDLALSLQTDANAIVFVGTTKESHNQRVVDIVRETVLPSYANVIDTGIIVDKSIEALDEELSQFPPNSLVFLLSNTLPKSDGTEYSPAETARLLSSITPFPVYTYWHSHIGHGAIGGQIVTGYSQGKAAAQLALEIMSKDAATPLPSAKPAPASLFFDLESLDKHDISRDALPEGTRFINYQPPIWQEYKTEALTTLVIIFGLASLVLGFSLLTKRQSETIHQISDENVELNHALDLNQEALDDVTHQLEEVNPIDQLTGLSNFRHFNDMLDKELRRASRYKTPISLLTLSVDQFEGYKSAEGEDKTNNVLTDISRVISETCQRSSDVLAHLANDKFAIILPHTTRENSHIVCQKIHDNLRVKNLPFILSSTGAITLSIGLSSLEASGERINPQHMFNTSEMMRIDAERQGGNNTRSDIIATHSEPRSSNSG
ncbi:GGDEF domain-containing protein [Grimontia sp. NTOU-MAR1]|uniref:GGDEF domain-containing protein n=1 Tax=Grimontia sp. NTOU-MAR1 TaxID=3111011 RepID=UPI002DBE8FFB|nr:GGDEF domain-containing protein [Grimontia sp. NTOU-MAR1]WRW00380.1 GGDEF domain-containing protein [Grimontia sp. NTOU-MAR1]